MKITLDNGLKIQINNIEISRTYANHFLGNYDTVSKFLRESMDKSIVRYKEYKIFDYAKEKPLPEYTCKANLFSDTGLKARDDYTTADICWFLEEINLLPQELVKQILEKEAWESIAAGMGWDDL